MKYPELSNIPVAEIDHNITSFAQENTYNSLNWYFGNSSGNSRVNEVIIAMELEISWLFSINIEFKEEKNIYTKSFTDILNTDNIEKQVNISNASHFRDKSINRL